MAAQSHRLSWYVVHTKPRRELLAAGLLADDLGVVAYLPEVLRVARGHRRKEPLFPGYVFIQADLAATPLSRINATPGVLRLLTTGGHPQPLPAGEVEALQDRVDALNAAGGMPAHSLRPGDEVTLKTGPLQGLRAVFIGPMRPAQRVRVLLEFLGSLSETEVNVADLEPVSGVSTESRPRRTRGRGRRIKAGD
jgi:transcriptional antiterminator RfaH